ncbi:MAG: hypothetical protein M3P83_00745 [Actinomycetota bacterium]|nr:hypothetical protein [Actinomycetota bacterium]
MTRPARNEYDLARLELNARAYRPNALLDRVADLMDAGDVEAWKRLPVRLIGEASAHRDLRQAYRDAVAAGAIPDDRGPDAA